MASVRPTAAPGWLFTGYTHDFYVRPCLWPKCRAAAWRRRDAISGGIPGSCVAARWPHATWPCASIH